MIRYLILTLVLLLPLTATAQWTLIDRYQVDQSVFDILPVRDSDPDYDAVVNEQMVVGSIVAVTDITAPQADRQLRILVDKGPPPVWEDWPPFGTGEGGDAATFSSYFNNESQKSFAFAYLIGNGTQSEISISNPYRHRNVIVDIREVDPPHASVGAEIHFASEDRINFNFTATPAKNQYAAYLILASTSRLIGGATSININHGFDSTHIIRQFQVTDTHHVTGVWNSANQTVLSATLSNPATEAYRLNMAHTFSYWDFPDHSNPSEIEHSLNERNLVYTVIDQGTFEEVGIDVDFEHSNFLKGTFTSQPTAQEYEMFSIPVKSPYGEVQGLVDGTWSFRVEGGEIIEVN